MQTVTLAEDARENGFCVMLKAILEEAAARHDGRLRGLRSRLGIEASDVEPEGRATLVLGGGCCTIEAGLNFPDLCVSAGSDFLPQLGELPLRYGLPWLLSEPGRRLLMLALQGEVQVKGLLRFSHSPLRTARALLDLLLLLRLLAGASA